MPLGKHTPYNRDSYGNLFGGEMNYSMQDRVVGDTIQDIEARRHQAGTTGMRRDTRFVLPAGVPSWSWSWRVQCHSAQRPAGMR